MEKRRDEKCNISVRSRGSLRISFRMNRLSQVMRKMSIYMSTLSLSIKTFHRTSDKNFVHKLSITSWKYCTPLVLVPLFSHLKNLKRKKWRRALEHSNILERAHSIKNVTCNNVTVVSDFV